MRVSLFKALIIILVSTVILLLIEYFLPVTALRAILGIPFVFFVPGFVLICLLFPGNDDISTTQRIILSFVASILVDAIIGLVLNFTPFGITFNSVLLTMAVFVLIIAVAGLLVQAMLPDDKRSFLGFHTRLSNPVSGALNIGIISLMGIVFIGVLGTIIYFSVAPKNEGEFTQFYIIDESGKLYSRASAPNSNEVLITIGIENHEGSPVSYRLQALVNNSNIRQLTGILLDNDEKWQQTLALPAQTTARTEIEFILFKYNEPTPYLESLRVWVEPSEVNIASK